MQSLSDVAGNRPEIESNVTRRDFNRKSDFSKLLQRRQMKVGSFKRKFISNSYEV